MHKHIDIAPLSNIHILADCMHAKHKHFREGKTLGGAMDFHSKYAQYIINKGEGFWIHSVFNIEGKIWPYFPQSNNSYKRARMLNTTI